MFRWIRRLLIILVVGFLLWILRAYPLRAVGSFLVVEQEPKQAQAIVVLSGESPARILGAYDLYVQGHSPRILLTHGPRTRAEQFLSRRNIPYLNASEMDRRALIELGVPEDRAVLIPDPVTSTFDEAAAVQRYLVGHFVECILLVTSRYHSRRAKMAFEHVFQGRVEIVSVPTLYDEYEIGNWWRRPTELKHVFLEYQKLAFYSAVVLGDWIREVAAYPGKVKDGKAI